VRDQRDVHHYVDFDPLDLLIVHAVVNSNVFHIMSDRVLDKRYSTINAVEPDAIKKGVSRAALARFLNLPLETVRRRVARLKENGVLSEENSGLIVSEKNIFKFGNNHHLQATNIVLVRKLLRDLKNAGVREADDLKGLPRNHDADSP
jgi:winged helix-turn-helix DNA-binding protein